MRPSLALLLGLVALLPACQLRLAADVRVDTAGAGTFEFAVGLDPELRELLSDAGVDVLAGLREVRERNSSWTVETEDEEDGGLVVRLRADFADPGELTALVDDLHAGLDEEDPRVLEDVRLVQHDGGGLEFTADAGLIPPTAPGAEGEGLAFDADDLERLLAERGDELVRYDLRLTLPGEVIEHDADEVDGASLVWRAPVGELEQVRAVSRPAEGGTDLGQVAIVAAVAAVLGAALTLLVRGLRRRTPVS
ncbi:MAG: hypothetical protein ACRDUY_14205 [Nitriliruptorales bacterium]